MIAHRELASALCYPVGDETRTVLADFPGFEQLGSTELEELYTRTFDINPVCSLEVGWHLFGEDYNRGAFLVRMRGLLREHGIEEGAELPDHLESVLRVLDAFVKRDRAVPGFRGNLCVGVLYPDGARWWSASFGEAANTAMVDHLPDDAGFALLLGRREARSVLEQGALPKRPSTLLLRGDRTLMRLFVSRYIKTQSWLDIRAGTRG